MYELPPPNINSIDTTQGCSRFLRVLERSSSRGVGVRSSIDIHTLIATKYELYMRKVAFVFFKFWKESEKGRR